VDELELEVELEVEELPAICNKACFTACCFCEVFAFGLTAAAMSSVGSAML
jgi:hypothetical protein